MGEPTQDPGTRYGAALAELGGAMLAGLVGFERALRWLHPPRLAELRGRLAPLGERLAARLEGWRSVAAPAGLEELHAQLARGAGEAAEALRLFAAPAPAGELAAQLLGAMRAHARAQEVLYPLRAAFPALARYFAEPAWYDRLDQLDAGAAAGASVGLHRAGGPGDRGGFSLYVPERYDASRPLPLVVALHGGFGHGREFVWTWLREARSRGLLLLAPTSQADSWALQAPTAEALRLRSMLEYVCERWRVDLDRVLLTGLSDGATFTLLAGLAEDSPYTALAPISGVLHPLNFANGNLARAQGRRIHLVHGGLDWIFPVALARRASEELARAGADLVYRELPDLSHAYPREENARILTWFAPELGLP